MGGIEDSEVHDLDRRLAFLEARVKLHDAQEAIRTKLALFCRGIDRVDEQTLRSVYHMDAIEDIGEGFFFGRAQDAITWRLSFLSTFASSQHCILNTLMEIVDDQAHCETYFQAYHRFHQDQPEGSEQVNWPDSDAELLLAGRYLDRFEERDGEWRIAYRKVVFDWAHTGPVADSWFRDNPTAHRGAAIIEDARLGTSRHPERSL